MTDAIQAITLGVLALTCIFNSLAIRRHLRSHR
jgi:hypothetical protein